jgi:pilus assembly protein Flp/PilA
VYWHYLWLPRRCLIDSGRLAICNFKGELMKNLKRVLTHLVRDESGQDLIEYALVAALIALGATAAMTTLAGSISTAFSSVGSKLNSAV